jgi:hypothetical protein
MTGNTSPISVAQRLYQNDLFYFTSALLADLLDPSGRTDSTELVVGSGRSLGRRQIYRHVEPYQAQLPRSPTLLFPSARPNRPGLPLLQSPLARSPGDGDNVRRVIIR